MYSRNIKRLLSYWPGKQRFGLYRFLPLWFALGGILEFSMINWQVGEVNFYKVYQTNQVKKQAEERYQQELKQTSF